MEISKAFNHIESVEKINELSVVLYTDSFFYGLWSDSKELLKSDVHSISNFPQLLKVWNNNFDLDIVRVLSTQKPYVHLLEKDFEQQYFDLYFDGIYNIKKRNGFDKEVDSFSDSNINTLHFLHNEVIKTLANFDFPYKISHISSALARYAGLKDHDLLAFVSENTLHIAYVENGEFKFYNQFYCKSSTDYLYYMLLIMNNYKLDPKSQNIYLGGHIVEQSPLFKQLDGYIANIYLIDQNLQLNPNHNIDPQLYFDLYLCRSCV
ncbi:DUF3822 family protein [bacterium]|nr:DUF3822 family protein [bacterium]